MLFELTMPCGANWPYNSLKEIKFFGRRTSSDNVRLRSGTGHLLAGGRQRLHVAARTAADTFKVTGHGFAIIEKLVRDVDVRENLGTNAAKAVRNVPYTWDGNAQRIVAMAENLAQSG